MYHIIAVIVLIDVPLRTNTNSGSITSLLCFNNSIKLNTETNYLPITTYVETNQPLPKLVTRNYFKSTKLLIITSWAPEAAAS